MKRSFLVFLAVVTAGATSLIPRVLADDQGRVPSQEKSASKWDAKMGELYRTLSDLLTDVTSDRRFRDPSNKSRIEKEADRLAGLSHDLSAKGMVAPDADPSIQIIAQMLGSESKQAVYELKHGDRGYARILLRSLPSYCIACHTRSSSGPQFSKLAFEPAKGSLTPIERGEFYAASRQFDRALAEFKKVIQDSKSVEKNPWDWETAIHQSLAIAIRVKKDPAQANEVIKAVMSAPGAPAFMKSDAKIWQVSVQDWQNEVPRQARTEAGLHNEALRLMAKAREIQKYPMDRTGDVLYLRASSVVHDMLQIAPQGEFSAEGFFLAGLSYEVLSPLRLEDLHDIYYELCIRKAPHSETAGLCYRQYEQSQYLGYTGSAGTYIPIGIRKKLSELRFLSEQTTLPPQ